MTQSCDGPWLRAADRLDPARRRWTRWAVREIEADARRSADTHLHKLALPAQWGVELYLKDESTLPTGSLKHRLARSLFLYALCNGWLREGRTVVEASSGSTAVSEAYFARLLGLPFVAVMHRSTSPAKIRMIEREGGTCRFVDDPAEVYAAAREIAREVDGHYMDQFTHAERATDWRGNNNIAESIFEQMAAERHPVPSWIVVGAGTGGTGTTIGRYLRYAGHATGLCVVDPERSAFYPAWQHADPSATGSGSRIEGIGRPQAEPSFVPTVVDMMAQVPDAASVAAMRVLHEVTGLHAGPSTGTSLYAALYLLCRMREDGREGSIVTLLCDSGDRYQDTYYDDEWLAAHIGDVRPYEEIARRALRHGVWQAPDQR